VEIAQIQAVKLLKEFQERDEVYFAKLNPPHWKTQDEL